MLLIGIMPRFDNESDLVKQRREEQRIESDNSRWGSESHEWERAEIEEHDQLLRQYKEEQDLGDVRLSEENLRHKAGQEESRSHRIFKNPIYERTYSNKPQASTQPSLSYPSSTRTTGPGAQSTSRTPGYNPKRLMATRLAAASQPQSTSIRNPPLSATVSGPSSSNSKSAERGVSVRIVDLNSKKRVEPSSFSPTAFSSPVSTSSPVEQIVTSILDRQGQQWDILLHTSDPIHWDTIPWPTLSSLRNPEDITLPAIAAYVMTIHDGAKDFLQDLMNMWLPDHFEDQFLHRVAERERVQVTNGVLAVFQSLYDLLSRELATRPLYEASKLLKPFQGTIGAVKERVAQKEKELFLREEDLLRREKDVAYQEREVENREQLVKDREESVKDREERVKLKEEELQNARLDHLRAKVIMNLALVFNTEKHYKQLLLCNKADAQVVMDSFQKVDQLIVNAIFASLTVGVLVVGHK
ncbi:hypothetical protein H0H93_010040 [Arthromyces matolae]|nr:hypothetical protein H0H93_010040 [Arthromyces matolae]